MNNVILIGRLAADPEFRTTQSGISQCTFRLAVNRPVSGNAERKADFITCVAWRTTADNVHKYLSKGSQAAVHGSIQTRSYDAQDGTKRFVTEVMCNNVEFIGTRPNGQETANNVNEPESEGFTEIGDDGLPF